MTGGPWSFHFHPLALGLVIAGAAAEVWGARHYRGTVTRRQALAAAGALAMLLVAFQWPLADLALHWSLAALVVQRLVLMLGVPALVLLALPQPLLSAVTRPAVVDGVLQRCTRPVVSVAVVTVVAVGTLSTVAVDAQSSSLPARAAVDMALLLAGVVLWVPVLGRVPGVERLSPLGRAAYLIVQSIVPSFLAIVWIFAKHPLYPVYAHPSASLGLSPVTDQQVAGFVAKLGTILVLWTVAFVMLNRSERRPEEAGDGEPLTWADVERHLQRAERAQRRAKRWGIYLPPVGDPAAGAVGSPAAGAVGGPAATGAPGERAAGREGASGPEPEGTSGRDASSGDGEASPGGSR